jgi:hypothetical protein
MVENLLIPICFLRDMNLTAEGNAMSLWQYISVHRIHLVKWLKWENTILKTAEEQ